MLSLLTAIAGVRYMVITSKHHHGFCMFDTLNPVKE
jgi:alpha-L-fucosidase